MDRAGAEVGRVGAGGGTTSNVARAPAGARACKRGRGTSAGVAFAEAVGAPAGVRSCQVMQPLSGGSAWVPVGVSLSNVRATTAS